jgi:methylamine dehydrogenase accessory protein MauD
MSNVQVGVLASLCVLVIAQGMIIVVMLRHIGVLYERIGPVGALTTASPLTIGAPAPAFELHDLAGQLIRIGHPGVAGLTAQLLLFVSPSCPICATIISSVRSFTRAERAYVGVVLASDGTLEEHRAYVARNKLRGLPYVVSAALGVAYGVSKLPYAVAIDREGIVRAKGLINSREHLESLVNALETGAASLQEWLTRASLPAVP